jgi:hypothetical protein
MSEIVLKHSLGQLQSVRPGRNDSIEINSTWLLMPIVRSDAGFRVVCGTVSGYSFCMGSQVEPDGTRPRCCSCRAYLQLIPTILVAGIVDGGNRLDTITVNLNEISDVREAA